MPSPSRCLTAGDAFTLVRDLAVHTPTSPPRVGIELEWLTFAVDDRVRRVDLDDLAPALAELEGSLPCNGTLTVEPGGQVEISTMPFERVDDAIDAALADGARVRHVLAGHGIEIIGAGFDRCRPPSRVVDRARYRAMETYFDAFGPEGRTMMCNSASIQLNVDFDGDVRDAWRAAHLVADRLWATCSEPAPNRRGLWAAIDPSRTRPVGGHDPGEAWARYALDARVMFIRTGRDDCVPMLEPLTLCDWVTEGHVLGWPSEDDVREHLTTLFPPVRPRGFLELRTIDAMDDRRWPSVVANAVALLLDGTQRAALLDRACP